MWTFPTSVVVLVALLAGVLTQCGPATDPLCDPGAAVPAAAVAKWPGAKSAAVSVNYDSGSLEGPVHDDVRRVVEDLGLRLDYELITGNLTAEKSAFIQNVLLPRGYDLFGHGKEHVSHDAQGAAWSESSAVHSRDALDSIGVRPIAFAYPEGAGYDPEVQAAIANAGFLSARLFAGRDAFIVPGDTRVPENWFALPTLRMESLEFEGSDYLINDTDDLIPLLDENVRRRSWLIMTYHSIGEPEGWGYYELADFTTDMQAIAERDLWVASLNDVTLYVYEYENATVEVVRERGDDTGCSLAVSVEDGRDDTRFNLALTVTMTAPEPWHGESAVWSCGDGPSTPVTFSPSPIVVEVMPDGNPCTLDLSG